MLYFAFCSSFVAGALGSAQQGIEKDILSVQVTPSVKGPQHIRQVQRDKDYADKAIIYGLVHPELAWLDSHRGWLDEITIEKYGHNGRYHQNTAASDYHTKNYEIKYDTLDLLGMGGEMEYMKNAYDYKPAVTVTLTDPTVRMEPLDFTTYTADTLQTAIQLGEFSLHNDRVVIKYHKGQHIEDSSENLVLSAWGEEIQRVWLGSGELIVRTEDVAQGCTLFVNGHVKAEKRGACSALSLKIEGVQYVTKVTRMSTLPVVEGEVSSSPRLAVQESEEIEEHRGIADRTTQQTGATSKSGQSALEGEGDQVVIDEASQHDTGDTTQGVKGDDDQEPSDRVDDSSQSLPEKDEDQTAPGIADMIMDDAFPAGTASRAKQKVSDDSSGEGQVSKADEVKTTVGSGEQQEVSFEDEFLKELQGFGFDSDEGKDGQQGQTDTDTTNTGETSVKEETLSETTGQTGSLFLTSAVKEQSSDDKSRERSANLQVDENQGSQVTDEVVQGESETKLEDSQIAVKAGSQVTASKPEQVSSEEAGQAPGSATAEETQPFGENVYLNMLQDFEYDSEEAEGGQQTQTKSSSSANLDTGAQEGEQGPPQTTSTSSKGLTRADSEPLQPKADIETATSKSASEQIEVDQGLQHGTGETLQAVKSDDDQAGQVPGAAKTEGEHGQQSQTKSDQQTSSVFLDSAVKDKTSDEKPTVSGAKLKVGDGKKAIAHKKSVNEQAAQDGVEKTPKVSTITPAKPDLEAQPDGQQKELEGEGDDESGVTANAMTAAITLAGLAIAYL